MLLESFHFPFYLELDAHFLFQSLEWLDWRSMPTLNILCKFPAIFLRNIHCKKASTRTLCTFIPSPTLCAPSYKDAIFLPRLSGHFLTIFRHHSGPSWWHWNCQALRCNILSLIDSFLLNLPTTCSRLLKVLWSSLAAQIMDHMSKYLVALLDTQTFLLLINNSNLKLELYLHTTFLAGNRFTWYFLVTNCNWL